MIWLWGVGMEVRNEERPHTLEYAFQKAKRCGAKTRKGTPCKAPVVHGKNRCRMHGGAKGSGASKGNKNALKHGYYANEAILERKAIKELIKETQANIMLVKDEFGFI
jgi:hypothetical protein